jgi:hypothetical protein
VKGKGKIERVRGLPGLREALTVNGDAVARILFFSRPLRLGTQVFDLISGSFVKSDFSPQASRKKIMCCY